MDPLKDDNRCRLHSLRDVRAFVQCEVVRWNLAIVPSNELVELLICEVKVECIRVVEVVVGCVFVLVIAVRETRQVRDEIACLCTVQVDTYVRPL